MRPRPTTTSEAATAITEMAKIWPSSRPCRRENAISSRFAAFSMISTLSRMISGLRRSITPRAPVVNRNAERITYHVMSGPCIALQRTGVRPEHDAADGGDEQHDRRHLECEQVVGEEEAADGLGRAEGAVDLLRLVEEPAAGEADDHDHLGEDRAACEHGADDLPRRPAGPRRLLGAIAEVGDHEEEHDHDRAAVDEHLSGRDELALQEQEEHGKRREVADQRE